MPQREGHNERAKAVLSLFRPGQQIVGAEVGVFCGDMSRALLEGENGLRLFMVDAWSEFEQDSPYAASGDPHAYLKQAEQDQFMRTAMEQVDFANSRVTVMRMWSDEAAGAIADKSLDFVFLDADHSYDSVKADIAAWAPKVKSGGWLGGHDYANKWFYDAEGRDRFGVKKAVDEFAGQALMLGDDCTWFVRIGAGGEPVKPS